MEFIKGERGALIRLDQDGLTVLSGYNTLLVDLQNQGQTHSTSSTSGKHYIIKLERGHLSVAEDEKGYPILTAK
jgi:hypothetical protein